MRVRFWALTVALLALVVLAAGLAGCTVGRVAPGPANTPVPTKTLRPTFTATVPKPTLTPSPSAGESAVSSGAQSGGQAAAVSSPTAAPPTATVPPPTPTQAPPTPEPAAFTVSSASINVRSGPGTAFAVIGRLTQGQSFPITGKNADGSWWQFDYDGKTGWVIGTNVSTKGANAVEVAQNIPQPPTAAPRPTAMPAAPKPAAPPPAPAATAKYGVNGGIGVQPNTNDYVTVFCLAFNRDGTLAAGQMRLSRDGQVVRTADFSANPTYYLSSGYNAGCKAEVSPAINGTYTAVLVEGDQVVSDPITFTVTGPENRIVFVNWKQR